MLNPVRYPVSLAARQPAFAGKPSNNPCPDKKNQPVYTDWAVVSPYSSGFNSENDATEHLLNKYNAYKYGTYVSTHQEEIGNKVYRIHNFTDKAGGHIQYRLVKRFLLASLSNRFVIEKRLAWNVR